MGRPRDREEGHAGDAIRSEADGQAQHRARKRPLKTVTLLVICVAVLFVLVLGLERFFYRLKVGCHPAALAAAISVYYDQYGDLPDTLSVMEQAGVYGSLAYRLPSNGVEWLWGDCSGPEPIYLPVQNWDGKSKYIVAVTGAPRLGLARGYVILGDHTAHLVAKDANLWGYLAADNDLRDKTGQPGRWKRKWLTAQEFR